MRRVVSDGNYLRLTPRERLTLAIRAQAHGDSAELKRLADTTPMESWRIAEVEFTRARDAIRELTHWACIPLSYFVGRCDAKQETGVKLMRLIPQLLRLAAMESVQQALDDVLGKGWRDVDKTNDPLNDDAEQRCEECYDAATSETRGIYVDRLHPALFEGEAKQAASVLASFDRFTRRALGLDGLTVIRAWMPHVAENVERLKISEHQPDEAMTGQWADVWARGWNRRMRTVAVDEGKDEAGTR